MPKTFSPVQTHQPNMKLNQKQVNQDEETRMNHRSDQQEKSILDFAFEVILIKNEFDLCKQTGALGSKFIDCIWKGVQPPRGVKSFPNPQIL